MEESNQWSITPSEPMSSLRSSCIASSSSSLEESFEDEMASVAVGECKVIAGEWTLSMNNLIAERREALEASHSSDQSEKSNEEPSKQDQYLDRVGNYYKQTLQLKPKLDAQRGNDPVVDAWLSVLSQRIDLSGCRHSKLKKKAEQLGQQLSDPADDVHEYTTQSEAMESLRTEIKNEEGKRNAAHDVIKGIEEEVTSIAKETECPISLELGDEENGAQVEQMRQELGQLATNRKLLEANLKMKGDDVVKLEPEVESNRRELEEKNIDCQQHEEGRTKLIEETTTLGTERDRVRDEAAKQDATLDADNARLDALQKKMNDLQEKKDQLEDAIKQEERGGGGGAISTGKQKPPSGKREEGAIADTEPTKKRRTAIRGGKK